MNKRRRKKLAKGRKPKRVTGELYVDGIFMGWTTGKVAFCAEDDKEHVKTINTVNQFNMELAHYNFFNIINLKNKMRHLLKI